MNTADALSALKAILDSRLMTGQVPKEAAASASRSLEILKRPVDARGSEGTTLPVCSWFDPCLAAARADGRTTPPAELIETLRPSMSWKRRSDGVNASAGLQEAHAYSMLVEPNGIEDRDDVWLGLTLMTPETRYPDHSHAPEEVYLGLSRGEFGQGEQGEWFEPGIGGAFYNPPGVLHGMRSLKEPMLALWLLPIKTAA